MMVVSIVVHFNSVNGKMNWDCVSLDIRVYLPFYSDFIYLQWKQLGFKQFSLTHAKNHCDSDLYYNFCSWYYYVENFCFVVISLFVLFSCFESLRRPLSLYFYFPGQNAIVIVSGANLKLTETDVQRSEGLISSARVVVCQLEIKPDVTITALKLAKKHNGNFLYPGSSFC